MLHNPPTFSSSISRSIFLSPEQMPGNSPAMLPTVAGGSNDIASGAHDDDDYGDFVFSSPFSSSRSPAFFPYPPPPQRPAADDDDWGDFVTSPLGSYPLQPPIDRFADVSLRDSSPLEVSQERSKAWEKPAGALPLSIFGEDQVEEPELAFENGLASGSFLDHSSPRLAAAGKLEDLIESLYGQAGEEPKGALAGTYRKEGVDDFDESSWEFKDAFLADATPKKDEAVGNIFALDMAAATHENGRSQVFVNRSENDWKGTEQFKMNSQERGPFDGFAAFKGLLNGSIGDKHSVTDMSLHELLPTLGNGIMRLSTSRFKTEFPENAIINGSTEDIKELEWELWDNHDLPVSAYANGKKNSYGSRDHIGEVKMDYSPVVLTSVIHDLYVKVDRPHATLPLRSPINDGQEIDEQGKLSHCVNGGNDFDQFDWEIQNAAVSETDENVANFESDQNLSSESNSCTLVELYCRLKKESLSFIVHHLGILKVPVLPGETTEVKRINEEIREAYGNLQEMMTSENASSSEEIEGFINQLLKITRESNFKAVEQEYHISERLLSAEHDLNAAVELFEHSSSVLYILRLASIEQQLLYINSWSKLASACAQELQHGANFWTELLDSNIRKQLLSKGNKYFIALGEVYRVSKVLKATVRLYMPWLLSNLESSCEMITCLEKCSEVWNNSGLEEVLQSISSNKELDDEGLTKALLDSIKLIDEVNEPIFHDPSFNLRHGICRFSLLPLDKLPGIKAVIWNGDWYITKLANLWANRVSPDPPVLPSIMAC